MGNFKRKKMSTKGDILRQPSNGTEEQTWSGFSWPALFFGIIWLLVKGLYGHFLISLVIVIATVGFAAPVVWIVYGFIGNDAHKKSLLKKGYLTNEQWTARDQNNKAPSSHASQKDNLTKLKELGELREKGVLTDEEFNQQKQLIISESMDASQIKGEGTRAMIQGQSNAITALWDYARASATLEAAGYQLKRKGTGWEVREPLGGRKKIETEVELFEYAKDK
jgi:Short C-terminal domain/Protein of unknown function (DUF2628)